MTTSDDTTSGSDQKQLSITFTLLIWAGIVAHPHKDIGGEIQGACFF